MDKIVEAICKAIPFAAAFGYWGISEDTGKRIAAILAATLLVVFGSLIKKIQERRKYHIEAKNLKPQFDYKSIRQATQYYIPTQFQNASPTREDEPKFTHRHIGKNPLIPFFLKTVFKEKREIERFYIILADSGMGKTTFMVNLYLMYVSFWNRSREKEVKIKLFRLGLPDTLDLVKGIKREDAINTILLLDALDEDPHILPKSNEITDENAFCIRVNEIIEATKNFREVVITCRTQYFPGQENDPYELQVKRPDEEGFYILNKLYISPFNDNEVKQYLNKKYPFWQIWKKQQKNLALQIVLSTQKLVVRPMLLSYIELLLEEKNQNRTVYDIYATLIEKWLIREALKRKPLKEREPFIENLRKVSQQTALTIYKQSKENKGLFLTKEQAMAIANEHSIELKPDEVTGQSLLTCDGHGNWKFAHKSILEFFLAKHAIVNLSFFISLARTNFAGMDMAKIFLHEKNSDLIFVQGGTLWRERKYMKVSNFCIWSTLVTQKQWEEVMGNNPSHFKGENNPVETVSWYDAVEFCNKLSEKYEFKPYYTIDKNIKDPNNTNINDELKYLVSINKDANGFRLPTEAEWEFAAEKGNRGWGSYAGSNNLDEVGWYASNSNKTTHPVGQKKANALGIFDMSGNVWEWCYDWYGDYGRDEEENPQGASTGLHRVARGGSWNNSFANYCSISTRNHYSADSRDEIIGFRIALNL